MLISQLMLASCQPAVALQPVHSEIIYYTESITHILNPERGFFFPFVLPEEDDFSAVRSQGYTLVHLNIRLDDCRERPIPDSVLSSLDANFNSIRRNGIKAIIRVAYNDGPWPNSKPDASKEVILGHIRQLKPLFQKHADVIAWVESGFIGAWGEWHTSTNGLDNIEDKTEILNALLKALPSDRMAQVRYPWDIIQMYPDPLEAAKNRVAHHNDCFVSSATDVGTYERVDGNTIVRDQAYLKVLTAFTPMSGETCAVFPKRSDCAPALKEMELLHVSALNADYHKGVIRAWKTGGCLEEISDRLGYRLVLQQATFDHKVSAGSTLELEVKLKNNGFAAPVNPRPVYLALIQGENIETVLTGLDARSWQPGESQFKLNLDLPNTLSGTYQLGLWLPDNAESLRSNPAYAIQFANQDTWLSEKGINLLGSVEVARGTGGSNLLAVKDLSHQEPAPPVYEPDSVPASVSSAEESDSPEITGIELEASDNEYLIRFSYTGKPEDYNAFQIFIDADDKPATGFNIGEIGAEYMLENDSFFEHTGGNGWSWKSASGELPFINKNNTVTWKLPLKYD